MKGKYIVFESVIGTGKTTLTEFVSERFGFKTMFEIVEENPFLEKFYEDPEHWSFQTECFFLCNRYMQLKQVRDMLGAGETVVGDYHILKNLVFAELTLKDEELDKYRELYNTMIEGFEMPDIIVYSEADLEEVERRIQLRGRRIEKDISSEYLQSLIDSYKRVMDPKNIEKHYPGTQIIKIDANKIDFYRTPERLNDLYKSIDKALNDKNIKYQIIG